MCKRSLVVVLALVVSSQAWAVAVLPGTSANAVAEPDPVNGAVIAGPLVTPLVGAAFNATLISTVIQGDTSNPYGGLTFVYEVINSPNSQDPLGRVTITGFDGWLTDMSYQPQLGGQLPPTIMDRAANGEVVGYSFIAPPLGTTALLPGATSELLVVQTNAPSYTTSVGNVIDGSIAAGPAYAPIPEPTALLLLVGSAGMWLRRRR
ncbi:MAG: hypothetical protein AMXMBFR13_42170 [Phycisphaerae bacterium]